MTIIDRFHCICISDLLKLYNNVEVTVYTHIYTRNLAVFVFVRLISLARFVVALL